MVQDAIDLVLQSRRERGEFTTDVGAMGTDPQGLPPVALKAEIQKGIDSAERGELISTEEVFDRLEAK